MPPRRSSTRSRRNPRTRKSSASEKEKYYTDGGRVVYGGGGITPDIEIEQDFLTDFEVAVERDGALFSFAVELAAAMPDIPRDFQVTDDDLRALQGTTSPGARRSRSTWGSST